MSGTQGRFPPAMPPAAPQGNPPAWPPVAQPVAPHGGHHQHQGNPAQFAGQPPQPAFAPRQQAQPPALPGGSDAHSLAHSVPAHTHFGGQHAPAASNHPPGLQAWVPQPPQPFPPATPNAPAQAQSFRPADPSAYDLGNYGVPPTQPPAQRQQPQQWDVPPAQRQTPPPMSQPPALGHAAQPLPQGYPHGLPAHAPQAQPYSAPYPTTQPPRAEDSQFQQQNGDQAAEYEYEYEEDEQPRSRRWMVAAALVGSIVTGGVLAYGYKAVFSPKGNDRAQIVRASKEPVKTAPANPGGRQIPNSGSAALGNRLPSEGAATAAGGDASVTDSNGVRRVSTVPVGRDATTPLGSSGVPGMQIVPSPGGFPTPGAVPASPQVAPPQRQAAVPVTQVPPPQARPEAAEPPAAPPRRQVLAPRPAPTDPSTQASAAPSSTPPRPKPTGHVAVLGYRRTQMDAMRAMADVQQRYEALRDRKLEVVQSDESSRGLGVIYRIVVGPRGSVAQAREVCTQLQQAGMPAKDCYTLAN